MTLPPASAASAIDFVGSDIGSQASGINSEAISQGSDSPVFTTLPPASRASATDSASSSTSSNLPSSGGTSARAGMGGLVAIAALAFGAVAVF
jgi:hypothetical protein